MKRVLTLFCAGLFFFSAAESKAVSVDIVTQGDTWDYSALSTDLWSDWSNVDYSTVDWNAMTWGTGNAAFGNAWTYTTYWAAGTDLALKKTYTLNGTVNGNLTLNVASDNGFDIFINGNQIAKDNAEGFTNYWEYTYNIAPSFLVQGVNTISVLAEDHGGLTYFDMKLTGDITPNAVPEPSTLLLLGSGLVGLAGMRRRFKALRISDNR